MFSATTPTVSCSYVANVRRHASACQATHSTGENVRRNPPAMGFSVGGALHLQTRSQIKTSQRNPIRSNRRDALIV